MERLPISQLLLAGALLLPIAPAAAAATAQPREWHFRVLLDGKPIGTHDFTVTPEAENIEVHTRAHFEVKVLFVTVYRYDHDDRERWHDGCLQRLDALTTTNGRKLEVHGALSGGTVFEVRGPHGMSLEPACVMSFAYWDTTILAAHRLLNPQTGEFQSIEVANRGAEMIQTAAGTAPAQHYTLNGKDLAIDLWYSPEGNWLALEALTAEGRRLRYEQ